MFSRLLDRNTLALADTTTPAERAPLLIERAVVLARLGRLDDARAALTQAAQASRDHRSPLLNVRMQLARATCDFLVDKEAQAIEAFQQAYADGVALGDASLRAECAAELAFALQHMRRVQEAIVLAAEALHWARTEDHATRYTAYLTLAILAHAAGLLEPALRLFRLAHGAAQAMDDQLGVGSVVRHMARLQALQVRIRYEQGAPDAESLKQSIVGVQSGIAFSRMSERVSDSDAYDYTQLAALMMLQKRYTEALTLLNEYSPHLLPAGYQQEYALAQSDRAICLLGIGDNASALGASEDAVSRMKTLRQAYAQALICSQHARILAALGRADAESFAARARAAWQQAGQIRDAEYELLDSVLREGSLRSAGIMNPPDRPLSS